MPKSKSKTAENNSPSKEAERTENQHDKSIRNHVTKGTSVKSIFFF